MGNCDNIYGQPTLSERKLGSYCDPRLLVTTRFVFMEMSAGLCFQLPKLNFDSKDWFWYQFEAILMPNSEKLVRVSSRFVTWFPAPVRVIHIFVSSIKRVFWRDQHKRSCNQYIRVKRVRVNCVGLYYQFCKVKKLYFSSLQLIIQWKTLIWQTSVLGHLLPYKRVRHISVRGPWTPDIGPMASLLSKGSNNIW